MSWGAIAGAAVSVVGGMVASNNGKKAPGTAAYTPIDPQLAQSQAIAGNIANQDDIEQLLTRANRYTQGQANDLMEQAVPGYGQLSATLMSRAQQDAANPYDVPQEVQDNLTRIASERGVSRGTRGQTNQFSLIRDLGVNQLNYGQSKMQSALGALQTLTGVAPRVSAASPLSFFLTPAQSLSAQSTNNQTQQSIAQGGLNAGAAAANYNNDTLWNGILKGAGMLTQGGINWAGGANQAGAAAGAAGSTVQNPDSWMGGN